MGPARQGRVGDVSTALRAVSPGRGARRGSLRDTGSVRGRRPPSACGFASWKRQLCSRKRTGEILENLITGQGSRGADWEGRAGELERSARRRGQGREGTPLPADKAPCPPARPAPGSRLCASEPQGRDTRADGRAQSTAGGPSRPRAASLHRHGPSVSLSVRDTRRPHPESYRSVVKRGPARSHVLRPPPPCTITEIQPSEKGRGGDPPGPSMISPTVTSRPL